jgi:diadenosine tetraphosphate (Ap4A) HIT family hydrolase
MTLADHLKNHPLPIDAYCPFCKIAKDTNVECVARFSLCYVIKDGFPVSPGHLLIIPYGHFSNWFSAPKEVRLEIVDILEEMKSFLDKNYSPNGYNIGANCGSSAGQTVMHLHVHLIPRYLGDMEDPRGGVRGVIPSKQKY